MIAAIDLAVSRGVELGRFRMIIYALLLILMMILRPQGLFGVNEIWDYLGIWKAKYKQSKAGGT